MSEGTISVKNNKTKTCIDLNKINESIISENARSILKDRYARSEDPVYYDSLILGRPCIAYADSRTHANRLYGYLQKGWFMFSTPILANGGSERGLPISCFLNKVDDSREGLGEHFKENLFMSTMGGGVGTDWSSVRSIDTETSKGARTTGVIPFIKVVDSLTVASSQGVTRRGATAVYLDVSHPEIEEFIEVRKPTGDINRRSVNIHNAVNITDSFMEAVEAGTTWDLIDPHTKKVTKTVDARDLWMKMLSTRVATGEPYLHFIDTANRALPKHLKDKGLKIESSNLCVAPETLVLTSKGYKKIVDLADKETIIWNGEAWSTVTPVKTGENKRLLKVTLSDGHSIECTPEHKFYIVNDYSGKSFEVTSSELQTGDTLEEWKTPDNDLVQNVFVDKVEDLGRISDTYCFTEHKRHRGCFNGIVTGQCSEIELPTTKDRSAICCLSSVNLEKFEEWKDDPYFIEDLLRMLDNALDDFIERAPKELHRAVVSAVLERSVGLGAMGFHTFLQSKGVPFEGAMASSWNRKIFSHLREQCDKANEKLGVERGACPDALDCYKLPRRFSHTQALAPNASISIFLDVSPSIEPYTANAYTQKTASGIFLMKNKVLDKVLKEVYKLEGDRLDEVWTSIITHEGSVQHLDFMSKDHKEVFKTAFELDQNWIVEHAAVRQEFIDQGQSINLFVHPESSKAYIHGLHKSAWKKGLKALYYCRSKSVGQVEKLSGTKECLSCEG